MSAKKNQGSFCFCLPICFSTKKDGKKEKKRPTGLSVERTQSNHMRSLKSGPISV